MKLDIEKIIEEMKSLGDLLVPNSFPIVSNQDEDEISLLKSREIIVDGYEIILYYGKSVFKDNYVLETFQVLGNVSPFLPFKLVSKLAKKFLGTKFLCYVDIFINNKKIYCWTLLTDFEGKPIDSVQETIGEGIYEGLKFSYLDREKVNFF